MTLSFAELVEQPAGTLVYTTSDGSITFDENLAGAHSQPVWGFNPEPLDVVMVRNERARYKNFFDRWQGRKLTQIHTDFVDIADSIQPTMPLGLLLNSIYVYTADEFEARTSSLFVEMFIDGQVQFVKMNVHNFFTQRRMNIVKRGPGQTSIMSDPLDDQKDFELFKTSRLLLQ